MSKPWIVSSLSACTIRPPSSSRPAERSEANGTISLAGKPRSRSFSSITVPTAPVAPTTATRLMPLTGFERVLGADVVGAELERLVQRADRLRDAVGARRRRRS